MATKSVKFIVHRRSKYKFRTKIVKGTRGPGGKVVAQGSCKPGSVDARADIEKHLGRPLALHSTRHSIGEWVFRELK